MKKLFLFSIFTLAVAKTSIAHQLELRPVNEFVIDDYKKINSSELPPAVVQSILKEYPTSKLRQAYKNRQNKYKLVMVLSSGRARTVYIDAYGRWLNRK